MSASELISDEQTTAAEAIVRVTGAPALGQKLRTAREELGLSIEDVSQAIKVQVVAIRQIETGDFDALGPSVFAKGFLRSYAKHVHLGQAWLDQELATLALDSTPNLLPSRGERQERSSTAERGMLAAGYLVGTAILVSAIFVVTHFDRFVGTRAEQTPQVSAPQAPTTESTIPLGTNTAVDSNSASITDDAANTSGAPSVLNRPASETLIASTPAPALQGTNQPQAPAQDSPPAVAAGMVALPNLPADSQAIELIATGTVWVEISDSTGRRLEFNNLSNGVRKSYSGKAPFTVKIGNAAYANLIAGGKAIDLTAFTSASVAKLNLIETNGMLVANAVNVPTTPTGVNENQSPD